MKDLKFLLTAKWLGAAVFILMCLANSLYFSGAVGEVMNTYLPIVKNNAADFLPITIEDGMIAKPENTLIEKTYGDGNSKFKVVLDTRTEEFEPSTFKESGLYISRSAVYTYNANKNETRINGLRDVPNMVIDKEVTDAFFNGAEHYIIPLFFGFTLLGLILYGLIIMGIYSLVLHWIMSAVYKAPYRQTLRVTLYSYVFISILGMLNVASHTFWLGFILSAVANLAVNMPKKPEDLQKSA